MAYMAIQNGLSVLLDGWSNSNLRAFFLLEIIVIAVFCVSGFILPNRRFTIGIQLMLAILGLVFFVKTSIWGVSSDAYILLPFISESFLIGALFALLIMCSKRSRKLKQS
ncbi:MAG: hypothetical protein IJX67_11290 [Oscillospiraceae bacterium]|nr:hypothetical protein [Oscillospiraceae bacterium]